MGARRLDPRTVREPELQVWGRRIGQRVRVPLWIGLYGPLGAGKSVLVRAVCRGAGVSAPIPSPTFTLVQRYQSPRGFEIVHVDLYRLEAGDSLEPLGWEEIRHSMGLVLLEWADRAAGQQPADRWEIRLDHADDPGVRTIEAVSVGSAPDLIEP